jgi:hypothetical protein
MPITLNHSNISVQYSSDKSYIIENVKSDLYLRNENYDNIVRNNLQTAPVTPNIYIENGTNNVYAVESYTYSGSANTADYTRVFTKSTTCDILIVGGGGGGGQQNAGGGGAGGLVLVQNFSVNGSFTIKIGKGGNGGLLQSRGSVGNNSTFTKSDNSVIITANGGGGGGSSGISGQGDGLLASNGGSGGGGGFYQVNGTQTQKSQSQIGVSSPAILNQFGEDGGHGGGSTGSYPGGGGGGAGGVGATSASNTTGQNGGLGIDRVGTFVFSQAFLSSIGDNGWFAGGGGSGGDGASDGYGNGGSSLFGGGGNGDGIGGRINGINGTGGGGGALRDTGLAGAGGSGIVIIRYLLGTIPVNNLLTNEPVVIAPTFTESVRAFVHSGGTEAQTTYTITVGRDTICDILIVGGGGGGGPGHGGGGGAGQLILIHQAILNGTYTINVGKGGIGGRSSELANSFQATKGSNSTFGTVIAEGGGANTNVSSDKDGGSGAGGDGWNSDGGTSGFGNKNTTIDIFPGATLYSRGNNGGSNGGGNAGQGGGGGGAGAAAPTGSATTPFSIGGDGLSGISDINYDFKTNFGNYGKLESDGNYWFAGGGGGGATTGSGGKGGGGNGSNNATIVGNATNNTGSGGGGGAGGTGSGGSGGSGIVIIKFKSITAILEGITHKRLNFAYTPNYPFIQADNTNLKAWYKFDGNYMDSSPSGFNLTNSGATIVDGLIVQSVSTDASDFLETSGINLNGKTYSISFWAKFNTAPSGNIPLFTQGVTDSLSTRVVFFYESGNKLRFSHYGSGNDMDTAGYNISSMVGTSWHHYVVTYNNTNRGAEIWLDGIKLNTNVSTLTNTFTGSGSFTIARWSSFGGTFNGLMEDFRYYDKVLTSTEISQLYNIPTQNTYTLNFPVPTIADINNNSNIVLRGDYDIALTTTNAVIIPKAGQYILPPTTFTTSNLSLRYHLLNPTLDPIGAQWTYSSNNTNVYHMGSVGIGTKSPEYQLDVRGFIFTSVGGYTQTGSENWVVQSDRRIKENIVKASYEKCLDNVKKIELYNFNFKDNCVNTNDKNQLGFIAQEVQQVYPKAVEVGRMTLDNNQGINDLLTLNTTQIKYTLYGAVKNLIERVENIESRVEQIYNMTLSSNIKSSSSNISITFITPLTSNITANTSNITANSSNITTNSSNITTNTSNITANTSNITTNSSNINTNTSNI